jgi:hypothetical protein
LVQFLGASQTAEILNDDRPRKWKHATAAGRRGAFTQRAYLRRCIWCLVFEAGPSTKHFFVKSGDKISSVRSGPFNWQVVNSPHLHHWFAEDERRPDRTILTADSQMGTVRNGNNIGDSVTRDEAKGFNL